MPLNCYDGACYYNSWTIPDASTVMMFILLRGWNAVVNKFFGTANDYETQRYLSDGKFTGDLYETSGNPSTTDVVVGTRIHCAIVANKSGDSKTYINGIQETTSTPATTPTTPANLGIGGRYGDFTGKCANAILEDVRVYNRKLPAQEIKIIADCNGTDSIIDGLINRWSMVTKGDTSDIGTDLQYDIVGKQTLQKYSGNVYYYGGLATPRKRV